jgi:hypothetical protein
MSDLRIYGIARTRAFPALWIAEELGLDLSHCTIIVQIPARTAPARSKMYRVNRLSCVRTLIPFNYSSANDLAHHL